MEKSSIIIPIGTILAIIGVVALLNPAIFALGSLDGAGFVANTVPDEVEPNETFRPEVSISAGSNDSASFEVVLEGSIVHSGSISSSEWTSGYYSYQYTETFSVAAPSTAGDYTMSVNVTQGDSSWSGSTNGSFTVTSAPKYSVSVSASPSSVGTVDLEPYQDSYEAGTTISVSADVLTQYEGAYVFDHWAGDITGTANPKTGVEVNSNMYIEAVFVESKDGGGDTTPSGPNADFSYSPTRPRPTEDITFDASPSTPGDADSIVSYTWDFGDGSTGSGKNATHYYSESGSYEVTLTVTNSNGNTDTISKSITVPQPNEPSARFTYTPKKITVGEEVEFDAGGSEPVSQAIVIDSYEWNMGDGNTKSGETISHSYDDSGYYTVELTVETNAGTSDTVMKKIFVEETFVVSSTMAIIMVVVGIAVASVGIYLRMEDR